MVLEVTKTWELVATIAYVAKMSARYAKEKMSFIGHGLYSVLNLIN